MEQGQSSPNGSPIHKSAAWGVHLLTAMGAVVGLMALIAIAHDKWQLAFGWMAVTLFIDSVDGTLARVCRVQRILPQIDGALLDNIVDYFTYVIVPAFFIYESDIVPPHWGVPAAIAITLASGYQFCQADAKTDDYFFKGFPSYWNVVVFYLFTLGLGPWPNLAILFILSVAVFVPVKYLYPSRTKTLRTLTLTLTTVWGIMLALAVVRYPEGHGALVRWSLIYIFYYFAMSLYLTLATRGRVAPRE